MDNNKKPHNNNPFAAHTSSDFTTQRQKSFSENKWKKFMDAVKDIGELPVCEFCGRCMLAGICCQEAALNAASKRHLNYPSATKSSQQ